jgi:ElaB/YqjD/DUF883 family membrane-anchored ribosome-binding protein
MSDRTSADTSTVKSAIGSAKDAAASAAEKLRESAPGAYDASAKAARYVGDTASEHPVFVLIGTAALAFLSGLLTGRGDSGAGRQKQSNWRKRGHEMSDRVRSAAPGVSDAATNAGEYVARNVRENPIPGLLITAAAACVIGYLLQNRR